MSTHQILESCREKLTSLQSMIPARQHQIRIDEIDHLVNNSNIWDDPKNAASLMKERQKLSDLLTKLQHYQDQISFYEECVISLPEELEANSHVIWAMLQEMGALEFKQMMKDPIDDS